MSKPGPASSAPSGGLTIFTVIAKPVAVFTTVSFSRDTRRWARPPGHPVPNQRLCVRRRRENRRHERCHQDQTLPLLSFASLTSASVLPPGGQTDARRSRVIYAAGHSNLRMADVFISYSRTDKEFASWLHDSLAGRGKDVWIDVEDIPPTATWLDEIFAAMEGAGAVILVLSPDAAASEVCKKEIAHALTLNKRLIPVVCRAVAPAAVEERIRALQWIDFTGQRDRGTLFETLLGAIDTDLEWVNRHTHLVQRAAEWERSGHNSALLLRGVSLQQAETWLAKGPEKDPKPSSLQTLYITESRRYATRVQRYIMGGVSVGLVVAVVLAVVAFLQRNTAVEQRNIAEERLQLAVARDLAGQATIVLQQEGRLLPRSVLLAVESLRRSPRSRRRWL